MGAWTYFSAFQHGLQMRDTPRGIKASALFQRSPHAACPALPPSNAERFARVVGRCGRARERQREAVQVEVVHGVERRNVV